MKPSTVEMTTTAMVQTTVFFSTRAKAGLLRTFVKFSKLLNPFIWPARVTRLMDSWKTLMMGVTIKMAIRIMLGAIQK